MLSSESVLMRDVVWTSERTDTLTGMWARGFTAQEIADKIGPAVTRSSVLGKVHRLQLPSRAVEVRAAARRIRNVKRMYGSFGSVSV